MLRSSISARTPHPPPAAAEEDGAVEIVVDRLGEKQDRGEEDVGVSLDWAEIASGFGSDSHGHDAAGTGLEFLSAVGDLDDYADDDDDDSDSYMGDGDDGLDQYSDVILHGLQPVDSWGGKAGRPAARSVVEGLPSVAMTEGDVAEGNNLCAICRDEIPLGGRADRLPCSHLYHGGCLLPWLRMRNTCPVCRHELPAEEDGTSGS